MATELPRYLIRLLVALLRHQARAWLGEEFMEAAGDALVEIGGEELKRGLEGWLRAPQTAGQLLEAARRAEEYVQAHCPDPALRGALTLRFADLPAVQAALADLPGALDSSGVERALRETLTRDLGRVLTPVQIGIAARLYTDALLSAVSTLKDFALPIIAHTVQDLRREQREQTAMLAEILQRLGRGEALQPEEAAVLGQAVLRGLVTVQGDVSRSVIIIGYGNTVTLGPFQVAHLRPQVTLPGDLPPGSYIPFPRNPLFTGREEDLRQLEVVLCGPHPSPQPPPLSRKRERGGGAAEGGGGGVRATPPLPLAHPVGEGEGPGVGVRARARPPHPTRELIQRARQLRRQGTPAECLLWECLRDRRLGGYKFRRQYPLGRFIADFYCPEARLIIEVDGAVHREATQQERDQAREKILRDYDYHLLRFTNDEVLTRTEEVLQRILERVRELALTPTPPTPLPLSHTAGEGEGGVCGPHPSPQPPPLSRKRERGGGAAEGGGGGVRATPPLPLAHPVGEGEGPGEGVRALITQAITGMGGVGKTQLAVEFACRYGYRFRSVHWLDLRDPALLDEQIAENGARMGLEPWPDKLPDQVARTLQAWRAEGPRLLILDNLEDPGAVQDILACLSHSSLRLLLTARRRDWPRHLGLQILPLEEFTPEESRAFLRHFLPPDRAADADLDALAERLGHLPLALELAGRYLERHPRLSVGDYRNALLQVLDHPSMLGWRPDLPSPTKHDLHLQATFALSWERVQDPDARRVFLLAGFCAPNVPIPEAILERMVPDPVRRDEALGELIGLGLLKGSPEGPAIHPLLADFAQADARRASAQEGRFPIGAPFLSALASLATETNDEIDRTGHYSLFAPLLPHLRAVAEKAEPLFPARPGSEPAADLARLWNSLGYHLYHVAAYAEAQACYERALGILELARGPEHPHVAATLNNLGLVLKDLGDLAGAKACLERALRIDEAAFGPYHPNVAIRVNNLGGVLKDLGDLVGAQECFQRALGILRQRLPPGHSHIRIVEENLQRVALHE